MRVLFLTHNYPRFPGDRSGIFIEELVRNLPTDEVQAYVLCPHSPGTAREENRYGIKIFRFQYAPEKFENLAYEGKMLHVLKQGPRGLVLFSSFINRFIMSARNIIEKEKIDLVHAHWLIPAGLVARITLRTNRVPLIVSSHGTDVRILERLPVGGLAVKLMLNRTTYTLPVSNYLGQRLENLAGRGFPWSVLSMPASDMFCSPPCRTIEPKIVGVGNLTAQKRFDILIKALGLLKKKNRTFDLNLIGDGPQRNKLTALAKEMDVAVKFLGTLPHHELPGIIRKSGVMVLPSVAEGFGLVLVEAQLAGLLAIGADSGGQRDIITHGKTGLLFSPGDAHELADLIESVFNDETKALRIAREGQTAAREKYLASSTAKKLIEIYRGVL